MNACQRCCAALVAMLALTASPAAAAPQAVGVETAGIAFSRLQPGRTRFGRLEFLAGLSLFSDDPRFGGYSGLVLSSDGARLVAVSDDGWLFTAGLDYADGRLAGLHDTAIAPLLGPDGKRPRAKSRRDAEALAVWDDRGIDGPLLVGFESRPRLELVDRSGRRATRAMGVPGELVAGPANGELEALARFPDGPRKGWLIALAEKNFDAAGHSRGWLWNRNRTVNLRLRRHADYMITDMALLPGGEKFMTIERSFSPPFPPGMALRLFDLSRAPEDEPLAGEVLIEARQPIYDIDNMEGIAVHRDADGSLIVTVISDDNFNRALQRTIILQFAVRD